MKKLVITAIICFVIYVIFSMYREGRLGDDYYFWSSYDAYDYVGDESEIYKSVNISLRPQHPLIEGGIIEVKHDNNFIIVSQNKEQKDNRIKDNPKFAPENKDPYYFWIIRKQTADVFGPYLFDEYMREKNALGVSKRLRFKNEKK